MGKLKLTLKGLDCAHCAGKIEELVGKLKDVKECTLNFSFKLLKVEYENISEEEMIAKIKEIVNKLEPDVVVEKQNGTTTRRGTTSKENKGKVKLLLKGLDCAHCAGKIEELVGEFHEVEECVLNFSFKLLIVKYNGISEDEIIEKIKVVVNKLEPDVIVEKQETTSSNRRGNIENKNQKRKVKLALKGLDCAHCAGKIEEIVSEFDEVEGCTLNFSFKLLIVEYRDLNENEMIEKIKAVVNKLEPHVVVEKYSVGGVNETRGEEEIADKAEEKKPQQESKFINRILENIQLIVGIFIYGVGMYLGEGSGIAFWFFLVAYIIVGHKVILTAVKNIIKGNFFDENFLMTIATLGAFGVGQYPEGVAVMVFYEIGEMFQSYAVNKSRKSISSLMDIKAEYANLVLDNGDIEKVNPEEVRLDEIILIKPGERVPLDGIIVEGTTTVDTSALTGESVPVEKGMREEILGGSINVTGTVKLKVTSEFAESTVARILELVENASSKKAKTERFITKFSKYYTPVVVLSAIAVAVIPSIIAPEDWRMWISRALIFLVVSCPCALVVSVPLGLFSGIGSASKRGILVKGGNYLEVLKNVDAVVFDKTGTLTEGVFKVTKIDSVDGFEKSNILKYAAACERFSNHPIAQSILEEFKISKQGNVNSIEVKNHTEISGMGIKGEINKDTVLVGNYKLMKKENIQVNEIDALGTIVYVAINGKFKGSIIISDKIKENSEEAIRELKAIGVKKVVMLTGDNKKVGEAVGQKLGVDEVYAELLPSDKVEKLEEVMNSGEYKHVAFIGDGINDAPVLARADLGVAMGGIGSDAAIEAADVVLMKDNPLALRDAIQISRKTSGILWQNIIFSLGIKFLVLILAVVGVANMWEAVFADVGVTLIAVINSMRALK